MKLMRYGAKGAEKPALVDAGGTVRDLSGVLADITRVLADNHISIDAMLQKEPEEGEAQADIILLTHETIEKNVKRAIAAIEAQPTTGAKVVLLRLENLA